MHEKPAKAVLFMLKQLGNCFIQCTLYKACISFLYSYEIQKNIAGLIERI